MTWFSWLRRSRTKVCALWHLVWLSSLRFVLRTRCVHEDPQRLCGRCFWRDTCCVAVGSFRSVLSGKGHACMLKSRGQLLQFAARCCGFRVVKDVVGPTRPCYFLKNGIGKLCGEKIGLSTGPRVMSGMQLTAWSLCSLRLFCLTLMFPRFLASTGKVGQLCTVGLLLVLIMLAWPALAGKAVLCIVVLRADGLNMVPCCFVPTVVIVNGCGTSACAKLILRCPSFLFVGWTHVCASAHWSNGKFALEGPMPTCQTLIMSGNTVVIRAVLAEDHRSIVEGRSKFKGRLIM